MHGLGYWEAVQKLVAGCPRAAQRRPRSGLVTEAGDPADVAGDPADAAGNGAGGGATTGDGAAAGVSRVRTARHREGPAAAVEEGATCSYVAKGKQRSLK